MGEATWFNGYHGYNLHASFFCNTDYIIQGCIIKDAYDGNVYTATPLINPTISSFKMDRNFGSSSGTGVSRAKYSWIAIGRWK